VLAGCWCTQYLVQEVRCLTLFVTHYPLLAHIAEELPQSVGAFHVSFLMEDGPAPNPRATTEEPEITAPMLPQEPEITAPMLPQEPKTETPKAEGEGGAVEEREAGQQARISFLYKLVPGVARSSFGLNVARMAQVGVQ